MMIYVDTSALVPAFIREPRSEAVLGWLESNREGLVMSEWSIAEFCSAAAIKVRTKQIGAKLASEVKNLFVAFAQSHCTLVVPTRTEFRRAAALAGDPDLNLRAVDALHLAIAEAHRVSGLLCIDDRMLGAAKALGMRTIAV